MTSSTKGTAIIRPEMIATASGCCIAVPAPPALPPAAEGEDRRERRHDDGSCAVVAGHDKRLVQGTSAAMASYSQK
jgi:hypothetical protein